MLTRIEISGFKNLRDVAVDFGPMTVIAGPNGVGKSNLFDAIELLSLLVQYPYREAFRRLRSDGGQKTPLRVLFPPESLADGHTVRLAAEVTADVDVTPPWQMALRDPRPGLPAAPTRTERFRYEVEFRVNERDGDTDLTLVREHLVSDTRGTHIWTSEESLDSDDASNDDSFDVVFVGRDDVEPPPGYGQQALPLLSVEDSVSTLLGHPAGAGSSRAVAAVAAQMRSWRFLSLEPSALRRADDRDEEADITASGEHLASTLYRRAARDDSRVYQDIIDALAPFLEMRTLRVVPNGDYLELRARIGDGPELSARSLSDGTLRLIALAALAVLDSGPSLVAIEEPENGLHPAKIADILELLRSMTEARDGHAGQVLVNTHSPYLVQDAMQDHADDVLCAVPWRRRDADGRITESVTFNPLPGTWRSEQWERSDDRPRSSAPVSRSKLFAFLYNPSEPEETDE
ncbi:AAA family ATPase [Actinomyces glycerinitolerans]|uniref:Atpase aaa-type core n=1 Tax=Actinomyces glycerinitolerans TaxID=1892869 RepID=A0A1M4RVT8_9ACTO|nr:AAA family ATPase [Actinomyces glycerinitolerans]SHE24039.1 atpase aaa-type core [Actinomyces glycerinitolerans]